jgi:hypothetical protein
VIERGLHRDRKLLDLAHEAPCMLQLGVVGCGADKSVPCHSDMQRHGRGVGCKSHDCLAVPGCPACHAVFTRAHLGQDGYEEAWAHAMARYLVWLWKNLKVVVASGFVGHREPAHFLLERY